MHKRRFSFSLITIFAENQQFHSRNDDSSNLRFTKGGKKKKNERKKERKKEKRKTFAPPFSRNTSLTLQIRVARRISVSQDGVLASVFFFFFLIKRRKRRSHDYSCRAINVWHNAIALTFLDEENKGKEKKRKRKKERSYLEQTLNFFARGLIF